MDYSGTLFILIISLLASAFFSGLEFAFISANRLKIALKKRGKGMKVKALTTFYDKPSQFVGTMLVGNNIALVIYSMAMAKLLALFFDGTSPYVIVNVESEGAMLLIETLISTIFILLFGEFLPKNLARLNPSGIIISLATPLYFFYNMVRPFVILVVWLARQILRYFFRLKTNDVQPKLGKVDLANYVGQVKKDKEIDKRLFQKALALDNIQVRDCMVPRTAIEGIDQAESIEAMREKFISSKHSKLIVYEESIDQIVGYIHHQDILQGTNKVWQIIIVPETTPAPRLLSSFIRERKSIAWVVDEFGGTAGIVTLEDIIEEIFGEIQDEHDQELLDKQIAKEIYNFSARLQIDYLNEKYHLDIPLGEYTTLAGYILTHHGSVPKKGEVLKIAGWNFTIEKATKTRLEEIKVEKAK